MDIESPTGPAGFGTAVEISVEKNFLRSIHGTESESKKSQKVKKKLNLNFAYNTGSTNNN